MKNFKIFIASLAMMAVSSASSQNISVSEILTDIALVQKLFPESACMTPNNIVINGHVFDDQKKSYGFFNNTNPIFPATNGVLITTGKAARAVGPNNSILSDGPASWIGDQDLELAINERGTINATSIEFDVTPNTNFISFDYIFSSEQYLSDPGRNQCNYSDGFAFLIKEVGSTANYQNLAVVPNTNIPVKVTTVRAATNNCDAQNEQYFGGFNGDRHPTNYNGQTKVLTASSTVTPGVTYHFKLVIADQGNQFYDSAIFLMGSSFKSAVDLGENRLVETGNALCVGQQLNITPSPIPGALSYSWFKDGQPINGFTQVSSPDYTISTAGDYRLQVNMTTSCNIEGVIRVEYDILAPKQPVELKFCGFPNQNQTLNINLEQYINTLIEDQTHRYGFYYTENDALNNENAIPLNDLRNLEVAIQNRTLYFKEINNSSCSVITPLNIQINASATNLDVLNFCDVDGESDGYFAVNLNTIKQNLSQIHQTQDIQFFTSVGDANNIVNQINNLDRYVSTTPEQYSLFIKVNTTSCSVNYIQQINIQPTADLPTQYLTLCGTQSVFLDAPSGYTSYQWLEFPSNTQAYQEIQMPGTYTLLLGTDAGCDITLKFVVERSDKAQINNIVVNHFENGNNSISVQATGQSTYLYSLDNINYQEQPHFQPVAMGEYTVYVKDIKGCDVVTKKVLVVDAPNFFTPNQDGFNDIWNIPRLKSVFPDAEILIFDRYEKLIKSTNADDPTWDGTYKGKKLPSTDYWYKIILKNGNSYTGHISLKR